MNAYVCVCVCAACVRVCVCVLHVCVCAACVRVCVCVCVGVHVRERGTQQKVLGQDSWARSCSWPRILSKILCKITKDLGQVSCPCAKIMAAKIWS